MSEIEKHNKVDDVWVVIDGKVWDMTEVIQCDHSYRGKKHKI